MVMVEIDVLCIIKSLININHSHSNTGPNETRSYIKSM